MRTRKSHGKERPSLPRANELRPIEAVREPSENRAAAGRFAKGNKASQGAGPKRVIARATSTDGLAHDEAIVAKDTRRLMLATLREVPGASDSTIVRTNAYGFARESSLAAYYDAKANAAGLGTPSGVALAERATSHRRVAERLSVTLLAEASTLAKSKPAPAFPWLTSGTSAPERLADEEHGADQEHDQVEQPDDEEPATMAETTTDDVEHESDQAPEQPSAGQSWERAHAQRASRIEPFATRWDAALGRMVPATAPAVQPARPGVSLAPGPDPRAAAALRDRASQVDAPAAPLPPGPLTMQRREDGMWLPAAAPAAARPSPEARAEMSKRGLVWSDPARKWVHA